MKQKKKPLPRSTNKRELLDDIERALFTASAAKRPLVEQLLWMAFVEASDAVDQDDSK